MNKKVLIISFVLIFLLAGGAYWYMFIRVPGSLPWENPEQPRGFVPLDRPWTDTPAGGGVPVSGGDVPTTTPVVGKIPTLRLLSDTPVGGYGASTTATTTTIRWVDRGRGNIYEAKSNTLEIRAISNTIVPKVYESAWNKNLTAFIGMMMKNNSNAVSGVYAQLTPRPIITATTSTSTTQQGIGQVGTTLSSQAPFELKGQNLPSDLIAYAVSPKKDKLFMLINESGSGIGYVSAIDGKNISKIFTTPLTQVNVEWPEENTIAITTRGSAVHAGFLYFVNPKSGQWTKVVGPVYGLSTRVSRDAKYVLLSASDGGSGMSTSIYNIAKKTGENAIIKTLADKCVWGNFYKELVYCASPSQPTQAVYPDDWYLGRVSMVDKMWQVNATTGEVKLISSVIDQSDRIIDAFNLGLDDQDNMLIFMNKNDLSLWSLDLIRVN